MQTVILCGGKGTRMKEETEFRPKPMVRVGGRPILWHIMKLYSFYGFHDFILCVGYKGDMIKRYFMEMQWLNNDIMLQTGKDGSVKYLTDREENWNVTIADTGEEALTGSRIRTIQKYIHSDQFMLTYGDGLSDVDLNELIKEHNRSGKIATLTGVNPVSPFGVMQLQGKNVVSFREKPALNDVINGGFMVLNRNVFDYIPEEDCAFEQEPLHRLARESQLSVYMHRGFWTAIDTHKDVERVNMLWNRGDAPWKIWD